MNHQTMKHVLRTGFIAMIAAGAMLAAPRGSAAAEDPSAMEIVHHANLVSYFQGKDGRARVSMVIRDKQGRERKRLFTILRRDAPDTDDLADAAYRGEQKYYVYFHRPADVSKMSLLVWKHLDRDDDRWLYLPALDLVKRIAASDKRTSFAGSDFFYEDVSGRNIDLDEHKLIKTTKNYYIIRNTPKDPGSVEFSYYDAYIHKSTFLPVQIEYFDKKGQKYRVYKALKVENIQGYATVTQSSMTNLQSGSVTTLSYKGVKYNRGTPEDIFSERYLRRAPVKHLR